MFSASVVSQHNDVKGMLVPENEHQEYQHNGFEAVAHEYTCNRLD